MKRFSFSFESAIGGGQDNHRPGLALFDIEQFVAWFQTADVQIRTGGASTVVKASAGAPVILGEVSSLPTRYRHARYQSVASRRPLRMPGLRPRLDAVATITDQGCLVRSRHCPAAQMGTIGKPTRM
jgi:hypothetical protein